MQGQLPADVGLSAVIEVVKELPEQSPNAFQPETERAAYRQVLPSNPAQIGAHDRSPLVVAGHSRARTCSLSMSTLA